MGCPGVALFLRWCCNGGRSGGALGFVPALLRKKRGQSGLRLALFAQFGHLPTALLPAGPSPGLVGRRTTDHTLPLPIAGSECPSEIRLSAAQWVCFCSIAQKRGQSGLRLALSAQFGTLRCFAGRRPGSFPSRACLPQLPAPALWDLLPQSQDDRWCQAWRRVSLCKQLKNKGNHLTGMLGAYADELRARHRTTQHLRRRLAWHSCRGRTACRSRQGYLRVLKYSSSFAAEQLQSLTTSLTKAMQNLRRLVTPYSLSGRCAHTSDWPVRRSSSATSY